MEGFGATDLLLEDPACIKDVLHKAQHLAKNGRSVLINAILSKSEFRNGSISI